ncbi:MAG TPA: alpha/beta hydrolase [Ramlibacter sp.]
MPAAGTSRTLRLQGGVGDVEVVVDAPAGRARGLALVAHPQPLLGGSAQHKVPHILARGLQATGWLVARPNFRGVGGSAGVHDEGEGETDDLLALLPQLQDGRSLPVALVGFSFGAFVQARVARRLADAGTPPESVVLAGFPVGEVLGGKVYQPPALVPCTLLVHGEADERVPLANLLAWCRPSRQPVVVLPGTDHYFTGRLPVLRSLVVRHLEAGA